MRKYKSYRVKILDFSYQEAFSQLSFRYLTYEVLAINEKSAIGKARNLYMAGNKELFSEDLPFVFKLFSIAGMQNYLK